MVDGRAGEGDSRLKSDLRLSRRSKSTEKRYLHEARRFFGHFSDRSPETLGEADVRAYLHNLIDVRRVPALRPLHGDCRGWLAQRLRKPEERIEGSIPWNLALGA